MASKNSVAIINEIQRKALADLASVSSIYELQQWKVFYLGRNGKLTSILRNLRTLAPEDRRNSGIAGNQAKLLLEEEFNSRVMEVEKSSISSKTSEDSIDVTMPGRPFPSGGLHVITQTLREVCGIFTSMGFSVAEGPEIEWDHYNFEALNIPKDHPARDMWNTLWVDFTDEEGNHPMLLRTHTSPMQARIMENNTPPVRVVIPGKCYRFEATDATHEWHFYQIEGLAIDKGITFADLKGTLYEFARRFFGEERRVRFRCDYFPFVEPGVDMSIDCFRCDGQGCKVCRNTGWIEILGAGMVHPKVLAGFGCDPKEYTGFAFGMGPERITMLRHGIEDIRHFYTNDLRFLEQF
mgnify:CR=1 FL=1